MTDIINVIKKLSKTSDTTLTAAIHQAGYNSQNIYNKFKRGNIYFSEVESILNQLGYQIEIKPKKY